MADHVDRAYDSFIVRLWREPAGGRWARAEIEHVQTGAVTAEGGVPLEWILGRLQALIAGNALIGSEPVDNTPPSAHPGRASPLDPKRPAPSTRRSR